MAHCWWNILEMPNRQENLACRTKESSFSNEFPDYSLDIRAFSWFFLEYFISFLFPCPQKISLKKEISLKSGSIVHTRDLHAWLHVIRCDPWGAWGQSPTCWSSLSFWGAHQQFMYWLCFSTLIDLASKVFCFFMVNFAACLLKIVRNTMIDGVLNPNHQTYSLIHFEGAGPA